VPPVRRANPETTDLRKRKWYGLIIGAMLSVSASAVAADDSALNEWLDRQVAVETWAADVEQTRKLRALVKPLVAKGRVTFAQPQRFRWELGDPPRTLAVGTPQGLTVAYPRLRQAERYRYSDAVNPAMRQVLDLLEVGFPSSADAFHERYELLSAELGEASWRFELRPRDKDARRLLERVNIEVKTDSLDLASTEFVFPDGSLMRNDFGEPVIDAPLDDDLFTIEIGDDWEVEEPIAPQVR
jgi:outer membrane lipoprotein-sorting protein